MANEWAAMAILPNGATIMVLTICAPLIRIFCMAIGMLILQAWCTYSFTQRKRFLVLTEIENPVPACRKVEIRQRDADIGKRRAAGSSHHAHLHDIDEQVIEHHIAEADQHRHHTRRMHVACRLEHHLGDMIQEHEGQRQTEYQKILRGIARNICTATQPIRQMGMHSYTSRVTQTLNAKPQIRAWRNT